MTVRREAGASSQALLKLPAGKRAVKGQDPLDLGAGQDTQGGACVHVREWGRMEEQVGI